MQNNKRALILGGAGYIATHIITDLLELDYKILVIDDLSTGSRENIIQNNKNYEFIKADFVSEKSLKNIKLFKPEVVFHFAALKAAGLSMIEPLKYSKQNIRKTFKIIEELILQFCPFFIFSSSAAVYGTPKYLPIDEKHELNPINYYGFTKKIIEDNLIWLSKLTKMRCAILRYFNAAGYDVKKRVKGLEIKANNLIPIIMEVVVGIRKVLEIYGDNYETPDGTCIRDYIHVNDLSNAHILAYNYIKKENKNLIINLGSEIGVSVKEVVSATEKIINKNLNIKIVNRREGDPPKLISSSKLAKKLLGWNAINSNIENIIKSSWEMYKK